MLLWLFGGRKYLLFFAVLFLHCFAAAGGSRNHPRRLPASLRERPLLRRRRAFAYRTAAHIYSEPAEESALLGALRLNEEIPVIKKNEPLGWHCVWFHEQTGYIRASDLQIQGDATPSPSHYADCGSAAFGNAVLTDGYGLKADRSDF